MEFSSEFHIVISSCLYTNCIDTHCTFDTAVALGDWGISPN